MNIEARRAAPCSDPTIWTVADLPSAADTFTIRFEPDEQAEMEALIARARSCNVSAENVEDDFFVWPQVSRKMVAVLRELRNGKGIVVMSGISADRFTKGEMGLIYWGLGLCLGKGVPQSAKGDRLGHVRDMSAHEKDARAYQNRNELNPHTDYTELVGLMCLRDARSGGETPLASSLAIHNEIWRTNPELLDILYRGFRYHRRGEQQPGEEPITPYCVPVFSRTGEHVSCRFIRPYIEAAAIELGTPLSADEVRALDLFQALANSEAFCLKLRLAPGSLVLFNNYTTVHSRTPFVDHDVEEDKRHLLRLWLLPENFRPVVPEIEIYSTKGGVQRREGGIAEHFAWGVGGH